MNVQFSAKGSTGEIWLYDTVGSGGWFSEGITAKEFGKQLLALGKVSQINLRINSPGGEVFDGFAIYNLLAQHPAQISVDVDGLAGSIASVIAMAAAPGQLRMAANASMMIHDPEGMAMGNATEMNRVAALLGQIKGQIVDTYAKRTGVRKDEVAAWMSDETWFTAEAAVEYGFADQITADQRVAACFDLGHFKNPPDALKRRVQAALRDNRTGADDIERVRSARRAQVIERVRA